eukprot:gene3802-13871_t
MGQHELSTSEASFSNSTPSSSIQRHRIVSVNSAGAGATTGGGKSNQATRHCPPFVPPEGVADPCVSFQLASDSAAVDTVGGGKKERKEEAEISSGPYQPESPGSSSSALVFSSEANLGVHPGGAYPYPGGAGPSSGGAASNPEASQPTHPGGAYPYPGEGGGGLKPYPGGAGPSSGGAAVNLGDPFSGGWPGDPLPGTEPRTRNRSSFSKVRLSGSKSRNVSFSRIPSRTGSMLLEQEEVITMLGPDAGRKETTSSTDAPPLGVLLLDAALSLGLRTCDDEAGPVTSARERPTDDIVNAITSFKRLVFHIGPLDFSTDQDFMETLLHYFQNLPTSYLTREGRAMDDIEAAYARGQINSCSSLALSRNSSLPLDDPKPEVIVALHWLYLKEEQDLSAMRDQSSSWFFLEEFYLSSLQVNITLNLTSNFNMLGRGRDSGGAGQGGGATDKSPATHTGDKEIKSHEQGGLLSGALTRISGGQGFQLINVTNAPISLASISLPNKLFNKGARGSSSSKSPTLPSPWPPSACPTN